MMVILERTGHGHIWREDHLKTQGKDGHLRAKGRGLVRRRNQSCQLLNWRRPAYCGLSPQSVVLLGPPGQTRRAVWLPFCLPGPL